MSKQISDNERNGRVVFGRFELDLNSGDLTQRGRPVALAAQPAKALALLASRAGQLVTRQELQEHVWGDTVVEVDQGLNACIRQIRVALGDRPDPPVFIETLPRRGYRFIAPVRKPESAASSSAERTGRRLGLAFAVLTALLLVVAWARWRGPIPGAAIGQAPVPRTLMAVLPFESLGPEADAYFAEGLNEELITELAGLDPARLGVIAGTSTQRYRAGRPPVDQIGRELGVGYVLEGSVRRDGDKVRIVAQLIRVSDRNHLWAQRYDRPAADVLAIQLDVASRVARSLIPELLDSSSGNVRSSIDSEAWEAYQKGRYQLKKGTASAAQAALEWFEKASKLDSTFALAHVGIADAHRALGDADALARRRQSLQRALAMDPTLADAHLRYARLQLYADWDFVAAGRSFARAVELDPGSPSAHHAYAMYLSMLRRHDRAFHHMERARELDPVSTSIHGDSGLVYFAGRRYEQAVAQCKRTLELEPERLSGHTCLLDTYLQLGRLQEAWQHSLKVMDLMQASDVEIAEVSAIEEPQAGLRAFFQWQATTFEQQGASPVAMAAALLPLGRVDEAFEWLERAFEQRSISLLFLAADPRCDPFRSDPRLLSLLDRLGFPEEVAAPDGPRS